ncbi:MAG: TetR/AcrR family transcriptional regulator [Epsilonproteobacteria bacterium]|nr:MAG: TetR/AcrR family transcriptional regulator [Campylobacterota bacterium]
MSIIVDKEKKRTDIACACKDILLEYGIKNLTISHIAKTAGIGKGTVYEYFENKEDIVFEIISSFIVEHEKELNKIVGLDISTKEKFFHFLYHLHMPDNCDQQLNIYREFIAISITTGTQEMIDFNIVCRKRFAHILQQITQAGIDKGEIHKEAQGIVSALITFELGLIIDTHTAARDPKKDIETFLNSLFILLERKG